MSMITGVTRGGEIYTPEFVMSINQGTCIGCGRCFKVCPRDVFDLVDREDLDLEADESDDEDEDYDSYSDDDGFSDDTAMVMNLKNALDCIGCGSCARICPKKCFSHQAQPA